MNNMEQWLAKWNEFTRKLQPGLEKTGMVLGKTGEILTVAGQWMWRLRKFVMAIPIVWLALYLARLNNNVLPEMVGINLQTNGEYAMLIAKETAVYGPLAVTAVCLLMMFLSRKTLYPWMICLFSMALPVIILITNIFPS